MGKSDRRILPFRDWAREGIHDIPVACFGCGGSPKRKHRTHAVGVVSANGCLVARTHLVSKTEKRDRMHDAVREINSRTRKGGYCPNDGGPVVLRCLRRVKRKLPILGTALRPGRLNLRPASSYLISPRMRNRRNGKPPALPLDLYLSWMSLLFPDSRTKAPLRCSRRRSAGICRMGKRLSCGFGLQQRTVNSWSVPTFPAYLSLLSPPTFPVPTFPVPTFPTHTSHELPPSPKGLLLPCRPPEVPSAAAVVTAVPISHRCPDWYCY
jgi:hypothetical protein